MIRGVERAEAYEYWLRARVTAARDGPRPGIPHGHMMVEARAIIANAKARQCRRSKPA
ncbi:antitoxin [Paraburkholderia sp. CNPSo 3281]|uniref:antitoxin PaaA2 family protein n=1 Tax=Paraburkholderia sp. CNPSo 3281 TaxID=2940933 RepID=UPI0035CD2B5C